MARRWSKNPWAHRRLVVAPHFENPQRGEDIKRLQQALNARSRNLDLGRPLEVDGKCGRATVGRAWRVARALGVGLRGPGVSVYVQHLIRHPEHRTKRQVARGKKWRKAHISTGPTVRGNKVTGGDGPRDRIVAAANAAVRLYTTGKAHRFYSQPGSWTIVRGITGERPGERSDCSQFATSIYHSAGAKDPNGAHYTGGYTGTLGAHGRYITRAQLQPGDLVLYGPRPHHHVEIFVPTDEDPNGTVGHGSPPVDRASIYYMADPHFVTYDL
jgi:hypothetical protein